MSSSPDEIPEKEFIERLRQRDVMQRERSCVTSSERSDSRRRAARVPGQRGSVSMYLLSELERVAALLAVEVHGRKTVERASREAWLQMGESTLPSGMTSRSYIVDVIDEKRAALGAEPQGVEFLDFVRNPIDIDADEDGTQSEKGSISSMN